MMFVRMCYMIARAASLLVFRCAFALVAFFAIALPVSTAHPVTRTVRLPYDAAWGTTPYAVEFDTYVDSIVLTSHDASGRQRIVRSGMLVPVAQRPVRRARPTVILPSSVAAGSDVTLTYTSEVPSPQMRIAPLATFQAEDRGRRELQFALILFAGVFIALALANLALFASFRDFAYVAYAGVTISAAFIALRSDPDIFWNWLFPGISIRYEIVYDTTILAYSFFVVAFARSFLSTRKLLPTYDSILVSLFAIFVVADVFFNYWLTGIQIGHLTLADFLYVLVLIVPFYGGILSWRRGHPMAPFYVVANAGVFLAIIIQNLLQAEGQYDILIVLGGIAWEGFWLIAALGDRVRRLNAAALDLAVEQAAAALHDSLTGLANRRSIEMDLRDAHPPYAVLYLDIDHFHVVNATAGHEAGDYILWSVARRLENCVRPDDRIARTSSDEFVVILQNRSEEQIRHDADALVACIGAEPFLREGQTFRITCSVGCVFVSRAASPSELLAMADAACAAAKEEGRNRVHFAFDRTDETARAGMQWALRASKALDSDRLALFYQPIVSLHDSAAPPHVELLVRLIDEDGSVIESGQFIGPAQRYSVLAGIDRWVIRHGLRAVAPVVDSGKIGVASINLSGNALQDADLPEYILSEIASSGIRPSSVCFEITETLVLSMLDRVRALISALREHGIRFSLDDFGTGTSSLSILKDLDVDYLKIDGLFVRDCATNPVDAAILRTIQDMAVALGLKTVAEYAKDSAVVAKLREIGIDYAQGWAFERAEPIERLTSPPETLGARNS